MKHLDIKIYGQVQGVSFRYYAREQATNLGLTGLVRNETDGFLYIAVEGESDVLKKFLDWCYKGPVLAQVENVEIKEGKVREYKEFSISHSPNPIARIP